MTDDNDKTSRLPADALPEKTAEYQPSNDVKALRDQLLKRVSEARGHVPDPPTQPSGVVPAVLASEDPTEIGTIPHGGADDTTTEGGSTLSRAKSGPQGPAVPPPPNATRQSGSNPRAASARDSRGIRQSGSHPHAGGPRDSAGLSQSGPHNAGLRDSGGLNQSGAHNAAGLRDSGALNQSGAHNAGLRDSGGLSQSGAHNAGLRDSGGLSQSGAHNAGLRDSGGLSQSGPHNAGLRDSGGLSQSGPHNAGLRDSGGLSQSGPHNAGLRDSGGLSQSGPHNAGLRDSGGLSQSGPQRTQLENSGALHRSKALPQSKEARDALALQPRPQNAEPPTWDRNDSTELSYASSVTGFHHLDDLQPQSTVRRPALVTAVVTALVGLGATSGLAWLALQSWIIPSRFAVLGGVATVAVAVAGAFAGASVWEDVRKGALFGLGFGLVCSLGCVAAAISWSSDERRAQALAEWKLEDEAIIQALSDPSDTVRAAACKQLVARDHAEGRKKLLPILASSPDAAAGCMSGQESSMALALSQLLAKRWSGELLGETPDDERFPKLASALVALPLPQAESDARLLSCTFSAPTTSARKACVETLGATLTDESPWPKRLQGLGDYIDGSGAQGLLAVAFEAPGLESEHKQLAKLTDATKVSNQWLALEVASTTIAAGATEPVPLLVASLENHCDIDVVKLPQSRTTWFKVSSAALESRKQNPKPVKALCEAATASFAETAVDNARALVRASIRNTAADEAKNIDAGWLLENERGAPNEFEMREMISNEVPQEQAMEIMQMYGSGQNAGGVSHPLFTNQ